MARKFAKRQKSALYLVAGGRCERCGDPLPEPFHGHHVQPWAQGGPTDVINGQALCPACNLELGDRMEPTPRRWQQLFIAKYHANPGPDFLLVACPAAGKTLAVGFAVRDLLRDGIIDRILVVVPGAPLREHWMRALGSLGIVVDGMTMNNGRGEKETIDGRRTRGWVVTYQSLYSDRGVHRILNARRPTLGVLDELHHLGERTEWGLAAQEALAPCVRRIGDSGTPFRGSRDEIPFVEYDDEGMVRYKDDPDGTPYARAFDYSYGRALHDNPSPVRPVLFEQYSGDVTWLECWDGSEVEKTVNIAGKLREYDRSKANRHVLDHRGDWLGTVLKGADERLSMVRSEGDPRAQGLAQCIDTTHAHAVCRVLAQIVGKDQVAVAVSKTSDGRDASDEAKETIDGFGASGKRWLVAVAMVSEGIDIPTLRVEVWATVVRAPLKFRQGLGRIVRRRGDLPDEVDQTAYMFIPKDPEMVQLADEVYEEVKLALLERDPEKPDSNPKDSGSDPTPDMFRRAEAEEPLLHAPGLGVIDPELANRVATESGQSLGAVVAVLATVAKLGVTPATSAPPSPAPNGGAGINSYPKRLAKVKAELEVLLRQVTAAQMKREGIPYPEFGDVIKKIKVDIYSQAGIERGGYERADIPQINQAIEIAKSWLRKL